MFSPLNYPYFQYILHELPSENNVADGVRNLTKGILHAPLFLLPLPHFNVEGNYVKHDLAFIRSCWLFLTICLPRQPKFRQILQDAKLLHAETY